MQKDRGHPVSNAQATWSEFNSAAYHGDNYRIIRGDDRTMLLTTVEWFARSGAQGCHGFDAGAGANLYPALAMLPFCDKITLLEFSPTNVRYLRRQVRRLDDSWEQFWEPVRPFAGGRDFAWARQRLAAITEVTPGSILTGPPVREFTLGTMFWVAESLSNLPEEYEQANHNFLGALTPGAPYCAAYMEKSEGYVVDGIRYPATPVGKEDVTGSLSPRSSELAVRHFDPDPAPIRPGEPGYLVATGRVKEETIS
ncbi:hypothetical protein [Actinomadura violacea]|uniref:Methyltransferase n=1 Tax=Actinomadura violacea TaxID=2819934 RepID=A0ABS3SAK0_9ACTN|nr:hypothetical protein [Actinomadura violacea]MBO2465783.1 hypothetical protein [Actinomadura violacea]